MPTRSGGGAAPRDSSRDAAPKPSFRDGDPVFGPAPHRSLRAQGPLPLEALGAASLAPVLRATPLP